MSYGPRYFDYILFFEFSNNSNSLILRKNYDTKLQSIDKTKTKLTLIYHSVFVWLVFWFRNKSKWTFTATVSKSYNQDNEPLNINSQKIFRFFQKELTKRVKIWTVVEFMKFYLSIDKIKNTVDFNEVCDVHLLLRGLSFHFMNLFLFGL